MQPAYLTALLAHSSVEHEAMWMKLLTVAISESLTTFDFLSTAHLGGHLAALNAMTQPAKLQSGLVRAYLLS